jgi:hypothetical protein
MVKSSLKIFNRDDHRHCWCFESQMCQC